MIFQESIIPKLVWDFVKKVQNNPLKAGILALLISNFLNKKENLSYLEKLREYNEAIKCPTGLKIKLKNATSMNDIYNISKNQPWGLCQYIAQAFFKIDRSGKILSVQGNFGRYINPNKIDSASNHVIYVDKNDIAWDPMHDVKIKLKDYLKKFSIITTSNINNESYIEKLRLLEIDAQQKFGQYTQNRWIKKNNKIYLSCGNLHDKSTVVFYLSDGKITHGYLNGNLIDDDSLKKYIKMFIDIWLVDRNA